MKIIIDACDAGQGYFYVCAALYVREGEFLRVLDTATRMTLREHIDIAVLAVTAELNPRTAAN